MAFTYDLFNRRISKTAGNQTIRYLWDGNELLAELDPEGNLVKSYLHGPIVDEVLYQEDYSKIETLFFHQDNLESTLALTDESGSLKESFAYDPFGNLTKAPLLPQTRFLYTGRELDFESNLYYSRNRYYDPQLGRFLSPDPTGYQDGLNLYSYARENPLSYRDPQGLSSEVRDPYWGGGKKGKGGGLKGILGVVLGIVAVAIAAPVIGAVAGAIGGAIGGAVGAAAGAVAGTGVGSAIGAAVGGLVTVAAAGAGAAIVSNAASNIVQGQPVFRGVGRSAITGAITGPINRIVSGITQAAGGITQIAKTVGSAVWNGVKAVGSAVSSGISKFASGAVSVAKAVGSAFVRSASNLRDFVFGQARGMHAFLDSPTGHQFLTQTSELSGAAAITSAIAAPAYPPAATAAVAFKGIEVFTKAIDIGFHSDEVPRYTFREAIKLYVSASLNNPYVSPFVTKGMDVWDEYLISREASQ